MKSWIRDTKKSWKVVGDKDHTMFIERFSTLLVEIGTLLNGSPEAIRRRSKVGSSTDLGWWSGLLPGGAQFKVQGHHGVEGSLSGWLRRQSGEKDFPRWR